MRSLVNGLVYHSIQPDICPGEFVETIYALFLDFFSSACDAYAYLSMSYHIPLVKLEAGRHVDE